MKVVVKVINDSVRIRMLDEMTGTVVRTHADLGMIVTPHHLTRAAKRELEHYRRSRIEVIDGRGLQQMLSQHGIGQRGSGGEVDYAFFGALEDVSMRLLKFIAEVR